MAVVGGKSDDRWRKVTAVSPLKLTCTHCGCSFSTEQSAQQSSLDCCQRRLSLAAQNHAATAMTSDTTSPTSVPVPGSVRWDSAALLRLSEWQRSDMAVWFVRSAKTCLARLGILGSWLLTRAGMIGAATFAQTLRLMLTGKVLIIREWWRFQHLQARHALGQCAYTNEMGNPEIRSRIAQFDAQIDLWPSQWRFLHPLHLERWKVCRQLGDSVTDPPDEVSALASAYKQVVDKQKAFAERAEVVGQARRNLWPQSASERINVAVGYAVAILIAACLTPGAVGEVRPGRESEIGEADFIGDEASDYGPHVCPSCGGSGSTYYGSTVLPSNQMPGHASGYARCWTCDGSGQVW